jgi:hypothetical protein
MKTAWRHGSISWPAVARQLNATTCFLCCCMTAPKATVVAA